MGAAVSELTILGTGLASSLGRDASTSCAAARAGLSRSKPLVGLVDADPELGESEPVNGHSVFGIPSSAQGVGRVSLLACAGLRDLFDRTDDLQGRKLRVIIALTDGFVYQQWASLTEGEFDGYDEYLRGKLSRHLGDSIRHEFASNLGDCSIDVVFGGATGVHDVLQMAYSLLQTQEIDVALVGGVDSLVDPHFASVQSEMGLLKSASRPDGASPGEAAAFLAITNTSEGGTGTRAQICLSDKYFDPGVFAEEPALGIGTASSLGAVYDAVSPNKEFRFLMTSGAGDFYRSNDLGCALSRLGDSAVAELPRVHVASHFGDTGAAVGFLAVVHALWLLSRPPIPESAALVAISSLHGGRCAMSIST